MSVPAAEFRQHMGLVSDSVCPLKSAPLRRAALRIAITGPLSFGPLTDVTRASLAVNQARQGANQFGSVVRKQGSYADQAYRLPALSLRDKGHDEVM